MNSSFSIIVAVDQEFGIGRNGQLPWHLPGDMKHFKEITVGNLLNHQSNIVIMGRVTWESIPEKFRPLSHRLNIVISRQKDYKLPNDVLLSNSFDEALSMAYMRCDSKNNHEVFVIGGAEIFDRAIEHPQCQKLYLTHIQKSVNCDRFLQTIPKYFHEVWRSKTFHESNLPYYFATYARKVSS